MLFFLGSLFLDLLIGEKVGFIGFLLEVIVLGDEVGVWFKMI